MTLWRDSSAHVVWLQGHCWRVCAGTYVEDNDPGIATFIARPLTLIGAGDGADPATSTILRPLRTSQAVIRIDNSDAVRLEGLRITGGSGGIGVIMTTTKGAIELPSVNNVPGNTPNTCRSNGGTVTGPGAVCLTT